MTEFTECWARDGIQAEAPLPTTAKLDVLAALAGAGAGRVELGSFVSPRHWPQFHDTDEVVARYVRAEGVQYSAYVPNERGYARLAATGTGTARRVDVVLVAVAASDSYNRKNVGRSLDEALAETARVVAAARADGFAVVGCVGTAWACPIEGPVPPAQVVRLAESLLAAGATELMVGDTTGEANPATAAALVTAVRELGRPVSAHFHDTRGTAMANAVAAIGVGVERVEGALGGVGGHPPDEAQHAPSGNLCTEDFATMAAGAGFGLRLDVAAVLRAGQVAQAALGRPLLSRVQRAGLPESLRPATA